MKSIYTNRGLVVFSIIWVIVVIYVIYYSYEYVRLSSDYRGDINTLQNTGIMSFHSAHYLENGEKGRKKMMKDALSYLPPNYVIVDYEYEIRGTSLNTFHRDITSSARLFKTSHPVYTLILYTYKGRHLSMCPYSHTSYPFVNSHIITLVGDSGTAYLFDSDVLHAGAGEEMVGHHNRRLVFQYKVCHRDDIGKLKHLQGVRANKMGEQNTSNWFVRKMSYFFEFPINYVFYPFMMQKEPENTWIGTVQKLIPQTFYNNI